MPLPGLMDPEARKAHIAAAVTGMDRISRACDVPDFFILCGWTWQDHQGPLARSGYITDGGCVTTFDRAAWTQIVEGVGLGEQVKHFTTRTGKPRRYTVTITPEGVISWVCRNQGKWRYTWGKPLALGVTFESLVQHASENPHKLDTFYAKLYG